MDCHSRVARNGPLRTERQVFEFYRSRPNGRRRVGSLLDVSVAIDTVYVPELSPKLSSLIPSSNRPFAFMVIGCVYDPMWKTYRPTRPISAPAGAFATG